MEWMLQLVDELDDAAASLALIWVGLRRGVGLTLIGAAGAAALLALAAMGATPFLICSLAVLSSAFLAFAFSARIERTAR